jgi:antitoxin VapB
MSSNPQNPAPPLRTAKLFKNGRSQAVRLPKEFRLPGKEVYISQNPTNGEIILTPTVDGRQKKTFEELFASWDALGEPAPALDRELTYPTERDFF